MDQTTNPITVRILKELIKDLPDEAIVTFAAIRYGTDSVMVVRSNEDTDVYDFENALKVIWNNE